MPTLLQLGKRFEQLYKYVCIAAVHAKIKVNVDQDRATVLTVVLEPVHEALSIIAMSSAHVPIARIYLTLRILRERLEVKDIIES